MQAVTRLAIRSVVPSVRNVSSIKKMVMKPIRCGFKVNQIVSRGFAGAEEVSLNCFVYCFCII